MPGIEYFKKPEHVYKILVIGDCGSGKTCLIRRYVQNLYNSNYKGTIGVDFALKEIKCDQNTLIRLQFWDIAGQERFYNMTRFYYKDAVGCFIAFDLGRMSTFESVVNWKNDLDSKVNLPDGSSLPCVLLANKCDLAKECLANNRFKTQMNQFCKDKGIVGWFPTSAKDDINIEEAAKFLVSKIHEGDDAHLKKQEELTNSIRLPSSLKNPLNEKKRKNAAN